MILLKWLFGLLAAFGGFVALMYVAQRALLYHPDRSRTLPASAGLAPAQEIELASTDGVRLVGWHLPPRGEQPVILYFQGNAGALAYRADRFRAFEAAGLGLVALSYRGYGGSTGSPSETGLVADGEAAYAFAAARYGARRIVVWGESLGTGVGVAVAAAHPVAALVLEAPYTSIADVAAKLYWFLPVRALIKDAFYSDRRIRQVAAPLLILHGALDTVVPIALGERLYALANEPKRFARFEDAGHGDLDRHGAQAAFLAFLGEEVARPAPLRAP